MIRIKNILHSINPNAEVKAFGSFASQLYLPDADIDLVMILDPEHQLSPD